VPWGDLALHGFALLVYPGALLMLGVGLLGQLAAGRLHAAPGLAWPPPPLRAVAATVVARPAPTAVLLAVLAATQLAIPFNPVSSAEQSVLVAVVALVAAAWVAAAQTGLPEKPAPLLLVQVCWLVAMLGPAVGEGTLQPTVLGAIAVPLELPVKISAAVLALLCLPALLQLLPEARAETPAVASLALWLPCCGLVASVFLPPNAEDASGVALFAAETVAAAVAALVLAAALRRPRLAALYWPALAVVGVITVVAAALTLLR
jgi:hypothetical protein